MSLPETTPDVDDLPPSAKYVVFVLKAAGGTLGRSDLQERTELPDRTLDEALDQLEEVDVIHRDRAASDLRFIQVELVGDNYK